jgi:hypothetical protein
MLKITVQDWIDNVLPLATNDFFQKCKTNLDGAFSAAKKETGDEKIGKYDTANNNLQKEFDGLPCSVMWLQSKVSGNILVFILSSHGLAPPVPRRR